jgi:hypothetical protein
MNKLFTYLVLVILIVSCQKQIPLDQSNSNKEENSIILKNSIEINKTNNNEEQKEFTKCPFEMLDLNSRDSLIEAFGNPIKEKSSQKNDLIGKDDFQNTREYQFDGLSIQLLSNDSFNENDTYFHVLIESKKYKLKYGISIGSTKDEVFKKLGTPDTDNGKELTYINKQYWYDVYFYYENNTVIKITWVREL